MTNNLVSVVGLGYVGLPVAVAFGMKYNVIGFDINSTRIDELKNGIDRTGEVGSEDLKMSNIKFTSNKEDLSEANFHIIAVPTPVDSHKKPDLSPMLRASESIGSILKKGDVVVYESTVYPGVCEEECLPLLERVSGLKGGVDFKIGYSPERINPGDKSHSFTKILKIVSAQDEESLDIISAMYSSVVTAGVYKASSIKVAEAAKVIENTQRDLNIALVNELSIIFDKIGIDTHEVLEAAGTKWNFIKYKPGLVGGHCIGVDPYYLTFKSEMIGYYPQVILSGRKINDNMGKYVAERCIKEMIHAGCAIKGSKVTIMGLTFKEDCPDLRNSRVVDILDELKEFGVHLEVFDPLANSSDVETEFGIKACEFESIKESNAVIFAVQHSSFLNFTANDFAKLLSKDGVVIDVKGIFNPSTIRELGYRYWRL
jgi:UDP-N-acetyl-D-galactosamine dehydrogenase